MDKPDDVNDKEKWLIYGEKKECEFVTDIAPKIGIDAKINPKKKEDKTAIDLIVDGKLTDLKCQNEPFFMAKKLYDTEPENCVTFNSNDFFRYCKYDEDIDLMFWVDWDSQKEYGLEVDKVEGVWRVPLKRIKTKIEAGIYPKHNYKTRINDFKNCRSSYVLKLSDMTKIY